MQRRKLMIPGPVDVFDDTLSAMGQPVIPHYGDQWIELYWETIGLIKRLFQTENDVFILTSSGSGALDAGFGSLLYTGEKALIVYNGVFGWRLQEVVEGYGIVPVIVNFPWGEPADPQVIRERLKKDDDIRCVAVVANETSTGVVNPVKELVEVAHEANIPILVDAISAMGGYDLPVDAWDIDICCTVANKCLETPPALGLISVSQRAWEIIQAKAGDRHHGWYLNLSVWRQYVEDPDWGKWHPYPVTMATSNILALRASLKRIVEEETLPGHFARLQKARDVTRKSLRALGFKMVADDAYASPTVTSVYKRDEMTVDEFIQFMDRKHGIMVAGAVRDLAGKVFRISHMGRASTTEYLMPFLFGVEDFLRYKGVDVPVGASMVGFS